MECCYRHGGTCVGSTSRPLLRCYPSLLPRAILPDHLNTYPRVYQSVWSNSYGAVRISAQPRS